MPTALRDPPGSWIPARRAARLLTRPLDRFLRVQTSSGIVLLLAATAAFLWANSPWHGTWALFVAALAFSSTAQLGVAKLAGLVGSATAAVASLIAGRSLLPRELSRGVSRAAVDDAATSSAC